MTLKTLLEPLEMKVRNASGELIPPPSADESVNAPLQHLNPKVIRSWLGKKDTTDGKS